jgi:hypothetical protein
MKNWETNESTILKNAVFLYKLIYIKELIGPCYPVFFTNEQPAITLGTPSKRPSHAFGNPSMVELLLTIKVFLLNVYFCVVND